MPSSNHTVEVFEQENHRPLRPQANKNTCTASSDAALLNVGDVIWKMMRNPVTLASDCTTVACSCGQTVCMQSICSDMNRLQSIRMIVSSSRWNSLPPRRSRSSMPFRSKQQQALMRTRSRLEAALREATGKKGLTMLQLTCMHDLGMIVLLLFLQKQNLAFAVYLFGIGTLHTGPGLKKKAHVIMLSP